MKIFNEVKNKAKQLLNVNKQSKQNQQKNIKTLQKPTYVYIPPIVIDDVTFSTIHLSSQKQIPKLQKQLLEIYDSKKLQKCNCKRLTIEMVRKKHFLTVIKTSQKQYKQTLELNDSTFMFLKRQQGLYLEKSFMRHFWAIDFTKLKVMNLSQHNLDSIQGLTFMDLPFLVCLQLHSNYLTSFDSLSKASMPKLQVLTLYNNSVSVADKLSRANFPQLNGIQLDTKEQVFHSDFKIENFNTLMKMNNKRFKKIYAQDQNRLIGLRSLLNFLKRNSPQFSIQSYRFHINRQVYSRNQIFTQHAPTLFYD